MRRFLVTIIVLLISVVLGIVRWYFFEIKFVSTVEEVQIFWRPSLSYVVYVDEISSSSPAGTTFIAKLENFDARIMVKAQYIQSMSLGKKLVLMGKLKPITDSSSEGFAHYLKLKNIVGVMNNPSITSCSEDRLSFVHYFLFFRQILTTYIGQTFSQDVSGILSGILLGDDDSLSKQTKEEFRAVGLTHVMAISGSNMTMVAEMVFLMLSFLPLKRKIIVTILILTMFTLLVGASAAVVRAYLMAIIALIALHFGLPYMAFRGLLFVVIVMFFINPYIPLYDVGFQLSVMATLGLLVLNPLLARVFQFLHYAWLKEIVAITLSASIFTLPLSLHYFGTWFPLSLVINILLVPVISALSLASYVGVALTVIPLFGEIVRLLLEILFRALLLCVSISSFVCKYLILEIPFSWLWVVVYYAVVFVMVVYLRGKLKDKGVRH